MIRINWADPITKGLKSLIAWDGRDYVANKPAVLNGTATGTDSGKRGVGREFSGVGDLSSNAAMTGFSTAATMLAVLNKVGSTGAGRGVAGNKSGTTGGAILLASLGTGQWGYGDGNAEIDSGETLAAGDSPILAVSVSGAFVFMYRNGVEVNAASISNAGNGAFTIGASGANLYSSGVSANVVYGAYWDRRLTAREHLRIARNEWCLFEPEIIFIPAGVENTGTSMPVTAGALTLTGQSVGLNLGMAVTKGDLTLTGQLTPMNISMAVTKGDLTLTGQTVGLNSGMPVTKGDLTLTGQTVGMSQGSILSVTKGDLTLTGQTVTFGIGMTVTKGDLALTGQNVALTAGGNATLAVDVGSLTLTGQSVGMHISETVTSGALALTGQSIVLDRGMSVTAGALTLTGQSVTLSVTGSVSMSVTAGTLTLTGQDVTLTNSGSDVYFRRVPAAAATSFVEIGQSTGSFTEITPKPAGSVDP